MWAIGVIAYDVPGLMFAGFLMGLFPPRSGYSPAWYWSVLVTLLCVVFWPMLAVLGVGYALGGWCRRRADPEATKVHAQPPAPTRWYRRWHKEISN
jgi:hypothetical protein